MSCADAGPFPFAEDVGPQPQATADGANPLEEGLGALSLLCPPSRALQGAFGRPFPRGLISRAWGRLVLAWGSRGTESGLRTPEVAHEAARGALIELACYWRAKRFGHEEDEMFGDQRDERDNRVS